METPDLPAPGDPDRTQFNSPYGPQTDHVDEAAGGADSSPLETQSSGEKEEIARRSAEAADTPRPA